MADEWIVTLTGPYFGGPELAAAWVPMATPTGSSAASIEVSDATGGLGWPGLPIAEPRRAGSELTLLMQLGVLESTTEHWAFRS